MVYPFLKEPCKGGMLVLEIFRLIFIIISIGLFVADYFWARKKTYKRKAFQLFVSFDFISYVVVFIFFIAVFIIKTKLNTDNSIFSEDKFENLYYKSKKLNYCFNLDGVILIMLVVKLFSFSRATNWSTLVCAYFNNSILAFLIYFVFIFVLILGFAVGGKLLWGSYLEEFSGFGSALVSTMFFICGFYNVESLLDYNVGFTIVFCILISFINLYFVIPVLYSIFSESFRKTIQKVGYMDDVDSEEWSLIDYKTWFLHFVPEKIENKKKV